MCTAKSEPVSHNAPRKKVTVSRHRDRTLFFFFFFLQEAATSMTQDEKEIILYLFLSPNTINLKSPPPCTLILCGRGGGAGLRWRSPRLQRGRRWVWARAGRTEPSAETGSSGGPLSRPAPGGCAGSWPPPSASASGAPGTPPGLARARCAPVPSSFP